MEQRIEVTSCFERGGWGGRERERACVRVFVCVGAHMTLSSIVLRLSYTYIYIHTYACIYIYTYVYIYIYNIHTSIHT
jgi:hypothetical protein